MKRVVSISLGSSKRNHRAEMTLLGERVLLERIGADGDQAAARRLYLELDGQVDAFGVGGTDLGIWVDKRYYPLHSVQKLVAGLRTPAVDGGMLRQVIERRLVPRMESCLPVRIRPKRVLIGTAVARWDLACSFRDAGYEALYGDLAFALGVPVALRRLGTLRLAARLLLPPLSRLPFEWLYPTGEKQEKITPRFPAWYQWATVIADDFHYLKQYMPERLTGKVIVTNTTTAADVAMLRKRGAAYLCTTTPRLDGRTFGTNVVEAALVAVAGKGRALTADEIRALLDENDLTPNVMPLNP